MYINRNGSYPDRIGVDLTAIHRPNDVQRVLFTDITYVPMVSYHSGIKKSQNDLFIVTKKLTKCTKNETVPDRGKQCF